MITTLHEDRLSALSHPYAVDGRVSWHAPSARGWAPMHCYVLTEPGHALIVETGLAAHQDELMGELESAIGDRAPSLLVLRQGEFDSVFNLLPIVHGFDLGMIYGQYETPLDWANFRTDIRLAGDGTISYRGVDVRRPDLETKILSRFEMIPVGVGRDRILDVFRPELLLLNTHWIYDPATKALLTSDMFTHVISQNPDGPWVVTAETDATTADDLREHLLTTRYWWLPDAYVDDLRRSIADVFERYEIETIAPSFGCILSGRDVVERHYTMLDELIDEVGKHRPVEVTT
jgi:hypothetical protein